ncbi:hypothetical protein FHP05_07670 [Cerasibacillus terrae]|uniref:Flagellar protein n=1 Tax=Cerasibacillus terrae TaxID=2498845 RepID=A0A5C8NV19_9BACI|nr:TIGR03826 family flagellar region protein [Cerasibacillus terrae]TXL65011.1 hypothetical protein FHP05_07670 [Cerasibacillus terrae]
MPELANCSSCGAVFVKEIRDICRKCYQEEEKAFRIVYDFLRQRTNREATLIEIVEATNIEEALIIKFIKENRLRQSQFPKLTYPCERCGKQITTGELCDSCVNELQMDLKRHEQEKEIEQRNSKLKQERENTYVIFDEFTKKTEID